MRAKLNSSIMEALPTRTAWAVFKYCGTKTVTLRMEKKYEKIDLKFISKETNYYRSYIIGVIL
jgi:hypothetical protein